MRQAEQAPAKDGGHQQQKRATGWLVRRSAPLILRKSAGPASYRAIGLDPNRSTGLGAMSPQAPRLQLTGGNRSLGSLLLIIKSTTDAACSRC